MGRCLRCDRPWYRWWRRKPIEHVTRYGDGSAGIFALCERCWGELAPAERLPWYWMLFDMWVNGTDEQLQLIEQAVWEGR